MRERWGTADLIEAVRHQWAEWDTFVRRLDDDAQQRPTNGAGWTVRDIVAHLTWFERETIELIRTRRFVGSPLWERPSEVRNAAILAESRAKSWETVRTEAATTRVTLLAALAELSDDDLYAPERFPPMPAELTPAQIIEDNTWLHYEAHRERLEAWLETERAR